MDLMKTGSNGPSTLDGDKKARPESVKILNH